MDSASARRWGYARIMTGTIAGGILGFYVMYRLESHYKAKWDERLRKYEEQVMNTVVDDDDDDDFLRFADNRSKSSHHSN